MNHVDYKAHAAEILCKKAAVAQVWSGREKSEASGTEKGGGGGEGGGGQVKRHAAKLCRSLLMLLQPTSSGQHLALRMNLIVFLAFLGLHFIQAGKVSDTS